MAEPVDVATDGGAAARGALELCVRAGGVAVFPADGLYGLACDPLSAPAIARIHRLKGRDDGKPSAVMYLAPLMLRELLGSLGPRAVDAVAALLPGALTLVLANPDERYPLACRADRRRLGVRLIEGPLAGASCVLFQTSANRSGHPAPARLEDVPRGIVEAADLAIDGGELSGLPSTVVDLSAIDESGDWSVLREGAVPSAELERRLAAI